MLVLGTWRRKAAVPLIVLAGLAAPCASAFADNEPPVNTVPGSQTTNEDTALTLSVANGNAVSVTDPDVGAGTVRVTLTATLGTLTLGTTSGLNFVAGTGTADATMTFDGTLAQVNTALDGLSFAPTPDANGAASLTIETNDLGNTGPGGPQADTDAVAITVSAVNDAPVNGVPGTQTITEETTLSFSSVNGNAITVADVDAGSAQVRVALTATNGVMNLTQTMGLTFTAGDGVADTATTFTASLLDANAALASLTFTPNTNYIGPDASVRIVTSDLGSTGSGGAKTDTDTVAVTLDNVDDAPVVIAPLAPGTYVNLPKKLWAADLNAIGINDVDGQTVDFEVELSATHGTFKLGSTNNVTITAGADDSAAVEVHGSRDAVNGALDGLVFTPATDFAGTATIAIDVADAGSALHGGGTVSIEYDVPEPSVYFANSKNTVGGIPGGIMRAEIDGGGGATLLSGPEVNDIPVGLAIDAVDGRVYWSITPTFNSVPTIYSANLDGSDKKVFISRDSVFRPAAAKLDAANLLVIDQSTRRIYWANGPSGTGAVSGISYVGLDDPSSGGALDMGTQNVTNNRLRGLALDLEAGLAYFTVFSGTHRIGYAPLPGASATATAFTVTGTVNQPQGVALDPATDRVFWTNGSGDTASQRLKVATLNGTTDITATAFDISPDVGGGLRSPAIDASAGRIYWANSATNKITSALLSAGGGAASMVTAPAVPNSPDGVVILRAPEVVTGPAISGTATVGEELTCGGATWAADAITGALYRAPASTAIVAWTRDGAAIAGSAGSATQTPTSAGTYRCTRTATNFAGTTAATSDPVVVADPSVATPTPTETPTPTTSPAVPALAVTAKRLALSATGTAALPVTCTGAACAGTLSLATTAAPTTVIASVGVSLGAGVGASLKLTVNAAGRRLAGRLASIPVTLTVALAGAPTATSALTLVPARAPAITPRTTRVKVTGRTARLRLACAAPVSGRCTGKLVLAAKLGSRRSTIATAKLSLRGARTSTVTVRLSRAARERIVGASSLHASQTVTSVITVGLATRRTGKIRLSPAG